MAGSNAVQDDLAAGVGAGGLGYGGAGALEGGLSAGKESGEGVLPRCQHFEIYDIRSITTIIIFMNARRYTESDNHLALTPCAIAQNKPRFFRGRAGWCVMIEIGAVVILGTFDFGQAMLGQLGKLFDHAIRTPSASHPGNLIKLVACPINQIHSLRAGIVLKIDVIPENRHPIRAVFGIVNAIMVVSHIFANLLISFTRD